MTDPPLSNQSVVVQVKAASEPARLALQAAAEGRQDYLCELDDAKLSSFRCSSGCSALHWAAGYDQLSTIRYLVEDRKMDVNMLATNKAKGRTPLHYACRNGSLPAARLLVKLGAMVDARAKHGVSPFQLAVWQNHIEICRFLVGEQGVDPAQSNDFDCGAVHWIGLCPPESADGPLQHGERLLPMVKWLATLHGIDFSIRQRQGHSPFHKAAWGAHIALLRWLRDEFGMLDDTPDYAGNYAADLAEMANDERHAEVAMWLRRECSPARIQSCSILGLGIDASDKDIRGAYLSLARKLHPDRIDDNLVGFSFDEIRTAYEHLTKDEGIGNQRNPSHSLNLMLKVSAESNDEKNFEDNNCFKARLVAVLLEYGDNGLDLSNIRHKWTQVWPDTPCPWDFTRAKSGRPRRKGVLLDYIRENAGDIVHIISSATEAGSAMVKLRNIKQSHIEAAATSDQ